MSEQNRRVVLLEAEEAVCSDRIRTTATPKTTSTTSPACGLRMRSPFTRADEAVFMTLVKVVRMKTSPELKDHWADIAGYAACGYPSSWQTTTMLECIGFMALLWLVAVVYLLVVSKDLDG